MAQALGHVNAALKLARQSAVVDRSGQLIRALTREACRSSVSAALTDTGFNVRGDYGTMEERNSAFTDQEKAAFAQREVPTPPPHLEAIGWCERILNP